MKLAILLFGAFITGLISLSTPVKDISGTWRIKTVDGICSPTVIRISMKEGIWIGKMDIPEQAVYDKEVYAVSVKGDSVFINIAKSGNAIKTVLQGNNTLAGDLVTDSSISAVVLIKR